MNVVFDFDKFDLEEKSLVINAWGNALVKFGSYFDVGDNYRVYVYEEFNDYCGAVGESRPAWGVTKHKAGGIYIYNPFRWTQEKNGHTIADLEASIVHELFHAYCYQNKTNIPNWFEEGVATYLSQDYDNASKDKDYLILKKRYQELPELLSINDSFVKHKDHAWSYLVSYEFVKFQVKSEGFLYVKDLVNNCGKNEKLFVSCQKVKWQQFKEIQHEK